MIEKVHCFRNAFFYLKRFILFAMVTLAINGLFMANLLILSSDTGEGHNSAAAAIEYTARAAGLGVLVRKPLEESGKLKTYYFCSDEHMAEFARRKELPLRRDSDR